MRDALLVSYDSSLIDDDEFVLLYDACRSKNPELPYQDYSRFCLEDMDEHECVANFRFKKNEIPVLGRAMGLPERFTCQQGTVCEQTEALCPLLRRICYPCRYGDLVCQFGRPVPELSMITTKVIDFIYATHGEKITQ